MKRSCFLATLAALALLITEHCLLNSSSRAADSKPIRVALFDDAGAFGKGVPRVTEQLGKTTDIKLTVVKGPDIAAGVLKDFDVVMFTGGSGHKEADAIGEKGRENVREFVRGGGGYVGICAGAYLACSGFSWGVGVIDAKTVSSKWQRGVGNVQIEVTPEGAKTVGLAAKKQEIRYANGPIIQPNERPEIPDYEVLAYFRTELASNGSPAGAMVNSPAIVRGTYGKGRVISSSPHPEQTDGMENFVERAVRWVAGRAK
ncbi:MAG: biofilm PGA synthesis protein PgaB [Verrucomicrobia bacterium]|nr:biofilm PGA synthesis protein PgaB [Verrucomicrobiota bacterium]